MSNVKNFKKLLSDFNEQIKELTVDLIGIFRIGKSVSPQERLAKADLLVGLAKSAIIHQALLLKLEAVVERVEGQRNLFARANKLDGQNNQLQQEEETTANAK